MVRKRPQKSNNKPVEENGEDVSVKMEQNEDGEVDVKDVDVKEGAVKVEDAEAQGLEEEEEEKEEDEEKEGVKTGDKASKNKLKKMKKKQKEKNAAAETKDTSKKLNPVAKAALQRLQLLKAQEEARKLEEEKRKKEEEERERQIQEEKRLAAEAEERKRLLKIERKEQLRAESKLLTQKEKEHQKKNQIFLEHLKASGAFPTQTEGERKKRSAVEKMRRKKQSEDLSPKHSIPEETQTEEPPVQEGAIEEEVNGVEEAEKEVVESWEDLLDTPKATVDAVEDITVTDNKLKDDTSIDSKRKSRLSKEASNRTKSEDVSTVDTTTAPSNGRRDEQKSSVNAPKSKNKIRSPVACILGHVDTGKTKLLDKIRNTNVQNDEAGGITQQIGATFFPKEALAAQAYKVEKEFDMQLPGLLVIDTPGHESFNNLRARGSSLCDIAILVVDIMHGLEPQTRESLGLLKGRKCPFVIALNKVDRLYGWKPKEWASFREAYDDAPTHCITEFETRLNDAILQLNEEGINCALYWKNDDIRRTVSIVPTSALTGEGIPDLLYLLASLTQVLMYKALTFKDTLQCSIIEVKNIEGLGTTIDVILLNGKLREGDTVVVCGKEGPIVTTIRALLTPQPLKELRVKGEYIHHKEIYAAMGIKIAAPALEDALPGTSLLVAENEEQIDECRIEVMEDMVDIFRSVDRTGCGVYVMASTLGSLEALLQFLKTSKIPVFAVNIGTVQKKDVKKASIMREKGHPEYCVLLAFDVKIDPEAEKEAAAFGVKIMSAEIIYHLFDAFTKYLKDFYEAKKQEKKNEAVFPCELKIIPQYIFHKIDPIVVGVKIEGGILKVGTPLVVPEKDFLYLGKVAQIEYNKKSMDKAVKGQEVSIKIEGDPHLMVGRHFEASNKVFSRISRNSIDCLKEYFRDELGTADWKLLIDMKKIFSI